MAPGFTLTDQFGKRVSLSTLRGKVVVVAFNDPKCTTICPLTTTALLQAKALLGPAASRVELLGIGANPDATQVKWARAYSRAHGMLHKWRFLTGSLGELKRVWRAYGIEAEVVKGMVDHTPATFVIGPNGRESRLYETAMAYSSVNQLGYELAQSISALLPGHPQLHGTVPLAEPVLHGPHKLVTLARAGGGKVRLGPGSGPHLVLFFDSWETEVTDLGKQLEALNRYQAVAQRNGLPPLVAVDEAGVEASPQALPRFLRSLPHPLVSGRGRPERQCRRRLPRAGLALARAHLGQRPLPLLRGSRSQGLARSSSIARHSHRRARARIGADPSPADFPAPAITSSVGISLAALSGATRTGRWSRKAVPRGSGLTEQWPP